MTEKLYYKDAYIKDFTAEIISVSTCDEGYEVVLDRTAFFPEEGGQSSDRGALGASRVIRAFEKDGVVYHITDTDPGRGTARCTLDFDERFEKMQCHTAEHILCGIIHRRFGLENVGFHLGADEITFDINGILTREQLDAVEDEANGAVFKNIKVEAYFPSAGELSETFYRSKLELTDNVRIVRIGDVDSCACCAPHVSYTGEIGLIKILDFEKHKGGLRIKMVAGVRALNDYRTKYSNIKRISSILSEPQHTTADALDRYIADSEALRSELKSARLALSRERAKAVSSTDGNSVHFLDGFSYDELREFAKAAKDRVTGLTVALSGADGGYKYIIMSDNIDITKRIKGINAALSGKGGGKSMMVQGTFSASRDEIYAYFS